MRNITKTVISSAVKHTEWRLIIDFFLLLFFPYTGNFYPEDRFLRVHMVKHGMQDMGLMQKSSNDMEKEYDEEVSTSFQTAFALTVQVLNTVMVPEGQLAVC